MSKAPSYFVLNEQTIGYIEPDRPGWFAPLASSIRGFDPKNGPIYVGTGLGYSMAPATLDDFHRLRLEPTGDVTMTEGDLSYLNDLRRRAIEAKR